MCPPVLAHVISSPQRCHISHFAKACCTEFLSPSLCSLPTPNHPYPPGEGAKLLLKAGPRPAVFLAQGGHLGPLGRNSEPDSAPLLLGALPAHRGQRPAGSPYPLCLACRSKAPNTRQPEERLGAKAGEGARRCGLGPPLPWPGPPRCRGAGGINQDNEAAACHAPRGH